MYYLWTAGSEEPEASGDSSIQNGPRQLRQFNGLHWQTYGRGDIGRQSVFGPVANLDNWHWSVKAVGATLLPQNLSRHSLGVVAGTEPLATDQIALHVYYDMKQRRFQIFEGDS
jgi:hypothetical protein